jgi:hypothetical protein
VRSDFLTSKILGIVSVFSGADFPHRGSEVAENGMRKAKPLLCYGNGNDKKTDAAADRFDINRRLLGPAPTDKDFFRSSDIAENRIN